MRPLISFCLFFLFLSEFSFAQKSPQMTAASESDPEAKAVLQKVRKKYEAYKNLEAAFSLIVEIPEQPAKTEKGIITQAGKSNYKVELPEQTWWSDGKSLWIHQKEKKLVQINDAADPEDGSLSPQDLLRIYERSDFVYVLVNEYSDKKRILQQIELKPLDKNTDYHKIRIEVDKKTADLVNVKAFFKDGARYTVQLDKITPNKTLPAGFFTFDAKKLPGVKVEDLRID